MFAKIKGVALVCCVAPILLAGCIPTGRSEQGALPPSSQDEVATIVENGVESEVTDTKRVGNDSYGYISIPANWMNFQDINPAPGVIQYTDGAGAIISINLFDADLNLDPQIALSSIAEHHESQGAEDMDGAMVTLNGLSAYQIYGYYPFDNSIIVIWMFEGPNGDVHYICAEAPIDTIMETVEIIEATYSFDN